MTFSLNNFFKFAIAVSSWGLVYEFYEGSLNGKSYLELLKTKILPKIKQKTPRNHHKHWGWLQDGAPCHWALPVNDFLLKTFGENVVARDFEKRNRCGLDWPPGSCDFNVLDISINQDIKQLVWAKDPPKTLVQLKKRVTEELEAYPQNKINNVLACLEHRAQQCVKAKGGHFEIFN